VEALWLRRRSGLPPAIGGFRHLDAFADAHSHFLRLGGPDTEGDAAVPADARKGSSRNVVLVWRAIGRRLTPGSDASQQRDGGKSEGEFHAGSFFIGPGLTVAFPSAEVAAGEVSAVGPEGGKDAGPSPAAGRGRGIGCQAASLTGEVTECGCMFGNVVHSITFLVVSSKRFQDPLRNL